MNTDGEPSLRMPSHYGNYDVKHARRLHFLLTHTLRKLGAL